MSEAEFLEAQKLAALSGIEHGFFTRRGGTSADVFASLNVSRRNGDDAINVAVNRARCAARLGLPASALCTVRQVHGTTAVHATSRWPKGEEPEADALVSDRPGVMIGVTTADCAPVLLADPEAGIVGAAHAGWHGVLDGIVEATVTRMVELGARREQITAAIGPCISQTSYEIGAEFEAEFSGSDPASAAFFTRPEGAVRRHFDLAGYCGNRLQRAGITMIDTMGLDTAADEERFFSYRRTCRCGETSFGLLLSAIALTP